MKSQYEKEFLSELKIRHKVLRALIHNKHQIRLNFSNSKAFRLLQMEINDQTNQNIIKLTETNMEKKNSQLKTLINQNKLKTLDENKGQNSRQNDDLLEIVKRQNCRLAPMGWHQQKQTPRIIQISRSYRRKRQNSKFRQEPIPLEIENKIDQSDVYRFKIPVPRSFSPTSSHVTSSQDTNVSHKNSFLNTINQKQHLVKMRNDSKKPLFENKFLIKRSNSVYNSLSAREKLATIIQKQQKDFLKDAVLKKNQSNSQPVTFLQMKKPVYTYTRKRVISTGKISNKLSKSRASQPLVLQLKKKQESCRPWTSRVQEQKVEQGKRTQLIQ